MAESVQQSLDVIATGRQNILDAIAAQQVITNTATSRLANLQTALTGHDTAAAGFNNQVGTDAMFDYAHGVQTNDNNAIAAA